MKVMGLRAGTKELAWAVLEGTRAAPSLCEADRIKIPKTYDQSAALRHVRERVGQLIQQHGVRRVVLKEMEANAKSNRNQWPRLRMEGVCIEVAASADTEPESLAWPAISSRIGAESSKGDYAASDEFRGVDLSGRKPDEREAVYAAAAVLEES